VCPLSSLSFFLTYHQWHSPSLGFCHQSILSFTVLSHPLPSRLLPLHLLRHLNLGLYILRFPSSWWWSFLDTRLRSEDVVFNGTLTTPTSPKTDSCWSGDPTTPGVDSRTSPIPCNVTGVSRGRIPITVSSTVRSPRDEKNTWFLGGILWVGLLRGLGDFYHNWTNSILQHLNFGKLQMHPLGEGRDHKKFW
jgi:hypothetical protein